MANEKEKFVVVSSCRVGGKHLEKGTILELDVDSKADCNTLAALQHAGRVAVADDDLVKQIKAEVAADKRREDELKAMGKPQIVTVQVPNAGAPATEPKK